MPIVRSGQVAWRPQMWRGEEIVLRFHENPIFASQNLGFFSAENQRGASHTTRSHGQGGGNYLS